MLTNEEAKRQWRKYVMQHGGPDKVAKELGTNRATVYNSYSRRGNLQERFANVIGLKRERVVTYSFVEIQNEDDRREGLQDTNAS